MYPEVYSILGDQPDWLDESGKYLKKLSESYNLGRQLYNLMVNAIPEVTFRFKPIFEFPDIIKKYKEISNSLF